MNTFDLGVPTIPSNAAAVFGSIAMNGDEYVRCITCGYGGCDVRVAGCGCTFHAVSFFVPAVGSDSVMFWLCLEGRQETRQS